MTLLPASDAPRTLPPLPRARGFFVRVRGARDYQVHIDESHRQMVLLALAELQHARPGWAYAIAEAAACYPGGLAMLADFLALRGLRAAAGDPGVDLPPGAPGGLARAFVLASALRLVTPRWLEVPCPRLREAGAPDPWPEPLPGAVVARRRAYAHAEGYGLSALRWTIGERWGAATCFPGYALRVTETGLAFGPPPPGAPEEGDG